jgi:hypothetical protein
MNPKLIIFATMVLASCSMEHEVSRVALPDTGLTVVVTEDEKSLYRFRIYPQDKSSDGRIIGVRQGIARDAPLPTPIITRSGDVATIYWPGTNLRVRIDVVRGQVIDDSNQSG